MLPAELVEHVYRDALVLLLCMLSGLFLPASAFKGVRRDAAEAMLLLRQEHKVHEGMPPSPVLSELLSAISENGQQPSGKLPGSHRPESDRISSGLDATAGPSSQALTRDRLGTARRPRATQSVVLRVLCRTRPQVEAALKVPWLQEVILDFLEVHGLKEAVAAVKAAGKRVVVGMPRILMPDEDRLLLFYLRLAPDALLLRGAGSLHQLIALGGPGASLSPGMLGRGGAGQAQDPPLTPVSGPEISEIQVPELEGDAFLNAANVLAADVLLSQGLSRLAPTHDLNAAQLAKLAVRLGPSRACLLEAVVHQHLPIFHTAHCVFCRFLSQ